MVRIRRASHLVITFQAVAFRGLKALGEHDRDIHEYCCNNILPLAEGLREATSVPHVCVNAYHDAHAAFMALYTHVYHRQQKYPDIRCARGHNKAGGYE